MRTPKPSPGRLPNQGARTTVAVATASQRSCWLQSALPARHCMTNLKQPHQPIRERRIERNLQKNRIAINTSGHGFPVDVIRLEREMSTNVASRASILTGASGQQGFSTAPAHARE